MSALNRRPIIIGSAPSSGSTLLVNLLGRVEGIYHTHELCIFDKPDWIELGSGETNSAWRSMYSRGYRRRLACEMRPVFSGLPRPAVPEPRLGEGYLEFLIRFMDGLAQQGGCRRWAEKTPANIFSMPKLVRHMPDARFLIITRDARAVIASLLKRGYSPVLAVARWYLSNLVVKAVGDNPSVRTIKYEELVTDPVATTMSIMEFIGEKFTGDMLAPIGNQKPIATWSASPEDEIRTVGLWGAGTHLDANARSAFSIMRATSALVEDLEWSGLLPSPAALQEWLGYPEVEAPVRRFRSTANHVDLGVAVARYAAAMLRHRLRPRQIPFTLDGN